mmetsp:Transcript_75284/g.133081  ORF Transcript_75284/g.133081 Transcript_75284/m.133081 type:complete len:222 (+) Transcript_75284:1428-2093(+)
MGVVASSHCSTYCERWLNKNACNAYKGALSSSLLSTAATMRPWALCGTCSNAKALSMVSILVSISVSDGRACSSVLTPTPRRKASSASTTFIPPESCPNSNSWWTQVLKGSFRLGSRRTSMMRLSVWLSITFDSAGVRVFRASSWASNRWSSSWLTRFWRRSALLCIRASSAWISFSRSAMRCMSTTIPLFCCFCSNSCALACPNSTCMARTSPASNSASS